MSKRLKRPSDRSMYLILRSMAIMAAALPPVIRAVMLFPVWREARTIRIGAGLGMGTVIAIVIILTVFRDNVIGTLKRHIGLTRVLAVAVLYALLVLLGKATLYIPKLEEIAFYALIGGLLSWVFNTAAMLFRKK